MFEKIQWHDVGKLRVAVLEWQRSGNLPAFKEIHSQGADMVILHWPTLGGQCRQTYVIRVKDCHRLLLATLLERVTLIDKIWRNGKDSPNLIVSTDRGSQLPLWMLLDTLGYCLEEPIEQSTDLQPT